MDGRDLLDNVVGGLLKTGCAILGIVVPAAVVVGALIGWWLAKSN